MLGFTFNLYQQLSTDREEIMIEVHEIPYHQLQENEAKNLYCIRKKVFKDRLNWAVECKNGMEIDDFDNNNAYYLVGKYKGQIISSVRLVDLTKPNMLRCGVFDSFFNKIELPEGKYLEASRLFIDKEKMSFFKLVGNPVCILMFFSMVKFAIKNAYKGIYTVVSAPMLTIYRRAGWNVKILETGLSEKGEIVHYLFLPVNQRDIKGIMEKLNVDNVVSTKDEVIYSCLQKTLV